jgi:hypothetical protein
MTTEPYLFDWDGQAAGAITPQRQGVSQEDSEQAMAGDWIKMREALHEDPAVIAMGEMLETRPEHIVGYCHKFWSWVSRNCHGDTVTGFSIEALESVLNLPGFLGMMCQVGWLEYDDAKTIAIPKFDRHLSQGAKSRGLAAERKRDERSVDAPSSSRSKRDNSVTREEKRREDNTYTSSREKFGAWWTSAPRKVGKADAERAYAKSVAALIDRGVDDPHGFLLARIQAFANSPKAKGDFCPHPATWLNQGRYDDDDDEWFKGGAHASLPRVPKGPEMDPVKANAKFHAG